MREFDSQGPALVPPCQRDASERNMAQSAEAKSTATTSTPSPHLEPALPPVRDLALAALLGSENPTASTSDLRAQQQMACFPSVPDPPHRPRRARALQCVPQAQDTRVD